MKNLNIYINEKLNIRKHKIETITKEQLDMLFLYCMCYLNDEDLYEDAIKDNYINWGEMERYSSFNIDWYDNEHIWISDHGCENVEDHIYLANLMDAFAESIINLLNAIISVTKNANDDEYDSHIKGILREFLFYIMQYIKNHDSSTDIDLTLIHEINKKINNRTVRISYKDSERWNYMIENSKIVDACEQIYDISKELIGE